MNPMPTPLEPAFAAALLDPGLPCPAGLRAWNGSDPARRFAVHRNNVTASLVDALADTFPVVQALVGRQFFRAMATVFVRRHPPRTPVLAQYGGELPDFIAGFEPAGALPYLADMARLELARVQAFHAADAPVLDVAAVTRALAEGADAGTARLLLHPATRLVASGHAVFSIWAAHQADGEVAEIDASAPEAALVVRPQDEVLVLRCDPGTAAFVQCLRQGQALADCAASAGAGLDLAQTLALLLANGALAALMLPGEAAP